MNKTCFIITPKCNNFLIFRKQWCSSTTLNEFEIYTILFLKYSALSVLSKGKSVKKNASHSIVLMLYFVPKVINLISNCYLWSWVFKERNMSIPYRCVYLFYRYKHFKFYNGLRFKVDNDAICIPCMFYSTSNTILSTYHMYYSCK